MTSTYETGRAKNIDNFKILISAAVQLGSIYNPVPTLIQLPSLNALLAGAENSSEILAQARRNFDEATNSRVALFEPLAKKASRIVSTMELSGIEDRTVDNAKSLLKKIRGTRTSPKSVAVASDPATPPKATISTSQLSYANQLANFALLVGQAVGLPAYSTNEPDLQPNGLNAYLADLKTAHNRVIDTENAHSQALTTRNSALYADNTGLVDVSLTVKKYVKTLNIPDNQLVKTIVSLEFRRR
jgi:hypothetical protein